MTDLRQAAQQALEALGSGNPYHQQLAAKVLRTALEQQTEPPPEWPLIKNILAVFGLDAIAFVAAWKAAQQQAEPPQRPWVGLTDEEMSDTVADMDVDFGDLLWKVVCLTKIIEAKLKERNGY